MTRYFCDVCGKEITRSYATDRLIATKGRVMIEVHVRIDGTWNSGHICLECLLNVINNGHENEVELMR